MICELCRDGSAISRLAQHAATEIMVCAILLSASASHGMCKGGTWCDCQHALGEGLQKQYRSDDETFPAQSTVPQLQQQDSLV